MIGSDSGSPKDKTEFQHQTCNGVESFFTDTFRHIGVNILDHLDYKSLINCKFVCKQWLNIIENDKFSWQKEINFFIQKHQSPQYPSVELESKSEERQILVQLVNQLRRSGKGLRHLKAVAMSLRLILIEEIWDSPSIEYANNYLKSLLAIPNERFLKVILENRFKWTPTITPVMASLLFIQVEAARLDNLQMYKKLFELTGVINPTLRASGTTLLHYNRTDSHIAKKSSIRIKKYIIEHVDPSTIKNEDGHTPLHFAAGGDFNLEAFKVLASRAKDINIKDNRGNTPLNYHIAIRAYQGESAVSMKQTCQFLDFYFQNCKSDPMTKNIDGLTPVRYATLTGQLRVRRNIIKRVKEFRKCLRLIFRDYQK